jgi:hypothetical protein
MAGEIGADGTGLATLPEGTGLATYTDGPTCEEGSRTETR